MGHDGADAALEAWQGPVRDLHDFRFADGLVEVKAWRTEAGARVHIPRPEQISVDPGRPLRLAAVQISTGSLSGRTLSESLTALSARMNGVQSQRFGELLAEYGYLDSHADRYPERLLVLGLDVFEVREGFPHIDLRFIPGGVVDVRYIIELGALQSFRCADRRLSPS